MSETLRKALLRTPAILLIALIPLTMMAPARLPLLFSIYYAFLNAILAFSTLRTAIGVCCTWRMAVLHSFTKWADVSSGKQPLSAVTHIILLPNYKEDKETLADTLRVLASHRLAKDSYRICLAMEESEVGCEIKAQSLAEEFISRFQSIEYSVHPKNLPGEQRGKSSNVSWAAKHMSESVPPDDAHRYLITATDADSCFSADYFESISAIYLAETDPKRRRLFLFTPFIAFDRNSSSVSPFVRMFDVSWSAAHMAFFVPSYPFTPALSSYSIPLELAAAVGFWDVGAEAMAEDMHMTLKLAYATGGRLNPTHVYTPVSQCNVVGAKDTWASGTYARLVQLKRHDWGGSLEFAFALRSGILQLIPFSKLRVRLPAGFFPAPSILSRLSQFWTLWTLVFTMFEITIWAIHALIINVLAVLLVPGVGPSFLAFSANAWWAVVSPNSPVDAGLANTIRAISYVQLSLVPCVFIIAIAYEGLFSWVSVSRWNLDAMRKGSEDNYGYTPLGDRSMLISEKRKWYQFWEWILFLVAAVVFALYMCYVALLQVFWEKLDYVVAAKPTSAGASKGAVGSVDPETQGPYPTVHGGQQEYVVAKEGEFLRATIEE